MEYKTSPAFVKEASEQGLVECYFAVMGNVDLGGDEIAPGAFKKTLRERGQSIKVLDNHQASSVSHIVGVPVEIHEVGRNELPPEIIQRFPDATGAVKATTQFLLDTPEGLGAFRRIKAGAINEWSFGYDPVDFEYIERRGMDGKSQRVRRLKQVRLWEYSPVIWARNPATTTLVVKAAAPAEEKPWRVFERDGRYYVYKVDADGQPVGDPLGEHETEDAALEQVRALYAAEPEAKADDGGSGEYPWDDCMADMMERYGDEETARKVCGKIRAASTLGKAWHGTPEEFEMLEAELDICSKQVKSGRVLAKRNAERIKAAIAALMEALADAGISLDEGEEPETEAVEPEVYEAGPGAKAQPPTAVKQLVEIEQELTSLLLED